MGKMSEEVGIATLEELEVYLRQYPDVATLEVMSVDMNGMLRGKRMPRGELVQFFGEGVTAPADFVHSPPCCQMGSSPYGPKVNSSGLGADLGGGEALD